MSTLPNSMNAIASKSCLLLGLLMMSFYWVGCDTNTECGTLTDTSFQMQFRRINATGQISTIESVQVDSLFSDPNEELFFMIRDTIISSGTSIPVNLGVSQTTYFFVRGPRKDTLSLRYNPSFTFFSPECGMRFRITNLEVMHHTFDSVAVLSNELFINEIELQIFL
jgi:hypothetical protein